MVRDEIVEEIVEEMNFVDMDKIVKEMVFLEKQKSFHELTTSTPDDYQCHKFPGSYKFYNHDFFS